MEGKYMSAVGFRFYHDQLPDDDWRDFYNKVEAAVRSHAPSLIYPKVLSKVLKDYYHVLSYVYNDHPEFFHFNYYGCRYAIADTYVKIEFCYIESDASMKRKSLAVNQSVDRILAECFPEGIDKTSELRREKKIFDWLTDNVVYDTVSFEDAANRVDILGDAWTVYGALVLKNAVCQGIACAFKMLCDRVNIPSLVVLGDAGGAHAWNIVRIDGHFYQVDCTWTLKHGLNLNIPFKRYQYLNITDDIIRPTHKPNDSFLPKCTSLRANPYRIKGLCCKDLAELYKLAIQHTMDGEKRFAFLCLWGYPAESDIRDLTQKMANAARGTVYYFTDGSRHYLGFEVQRRN